MPFFLSIEDLEEELAWLDPAERWELILQPLMRALAQEQLGKVLNPDSLVREVDGRKVVDADEIAMEVTDLEKARELVLRIEQQAMASKGRSEG
jgi:hypothetical protein